MLFHHVKMLSSLYISCITSTLLRRMQSLWQLNVKHCSLSFQKIPFELTYKTFFPRKYIERRTNSIMGNLKPYLIRRSCVSLGFFFNSIFIKVIRWVISTTKVWFVTIFAFSQWLNNHNKFHRLKTAIKSSVIDHSFKVYLNNTKGNFMKSI